MLDELLAGRPWLGGAVLVAPKELHVRRSSDVHEVRDAEVAAALRYMAGNCDKPITVDLIARKVRMGRRTLERRFRQVAGETVSAKLTAMRVEKVRRLLLDTDDPVNSIHRDAGFGSSEQMRAALQKVTGMTPNALRSQIKKNLDK